MFSNVTENIFLKIAIIMIAVFCVVTLFSVNAERAELEAKKQALLENIKRCEENILSMENDLSKPYDDDYIIRAAREKLNMHLPEEIVFITDFTD